MINTDLLGAQQHLTAETEEPPIPETGFTQNLLMAGAVTAKRGIIGPCTTKRGGLTVTIAARTRIGARVPGAAAGSQRSGSRGAPGPGLIPAARLLPPERRVAPTSLVGKGNTKRDIWTRRRTTQLLPRVRGAPPPPR